MPIFVVHFFDEHEHARGAVRLVSRTEDAAIREAASLDHVHVLEVWEGDRRVWRREPLVHLEAAA